MSQISCDYYRHYVLHGSCYMIQNVPIHQIHNVCSHERHLNVQIMVNIWSRLIFYKSGGQYLVTPIHLHCTKESVFLAQLSHIVLIQSYPVNLTLLQQSSSPPGNAAHL